MFIVIIIITIIKQEINKEMSSVKENINNLTRLTSKHASIMIKSRKMGWAGQTARNGEMKTEDTILDIMKVRVRLRDLGVDGKTTLKSMLC